MDVILLAPPRDGEPTPPSPEGPRLHGPLGEQRLRALIAWFMDRAQFVRLIAFVPAAEADFRWLLDFLSAAARSYGVEAVAILLLEQVTEDRLEALHTYGILDLVVLATMDRWESASAAMTTLARFRSARAAVARSGRGLSCRLWLAPGAGWEHHRRLASLSRGAPWLAIDTPGFDLAAETAAVPHALPEELRALPGGCWLYDQSLTIDAAGRVRICPRHAAGEEQGAGDLFGHTPEELLSRKTTVRGRVGQTAACRLCQVRGRFQWPESERPRPLPANAGAAAPAGAALAIVAPATAAPAGSPAGDGRAPLPFLQEILAVEGGAGAEALGAFEDRLETWRARLEEWDPGEGQPG
jgi:hypothetical protein